MSTQPLSRETIRDRTDALALASDHDNEEIVSDRREVSAFFEQLKQSGSTIPEHLIEIAHLLTDEEYDRLGPVIPRAVLQSIIARAVHTGAAQVISETGSSTLEAIQLDMLLANGIPPAD